MAIPDTELTLKQDAFDAIARLARSEFGLHISPEKVKLVQSRLRHRVNALDMPSFDTYSELVCSENGTDERRRMISALTTNVSHFFREPHHFDMLSQSLLPDIRDRIASGDRIRIWSAGCSNGQEPYSIAMHMLRQEPLLATSDFKILATDIDPKVIAFSQKGEYDQKLVAGVSAQDQAGFMTAKDAVLQVGEDVRRHVFFRELNLLSKWPMRHQFDAIFCRNVVIYFDVETQERLWPRFRRALKPDGILFLGHSERITGPAQFGFKTVGTTAYKKGDAASATSSHPSGG